MGFRLIGMSWSSMAVFLCVINLAAFILVLFHRYRFGSRSRPGAGEKSPGKNTACGNRRKIEFILAVLVLIDFLDICKEEEKFAFFSMAQLTAQLIGMAAVLFLWKGMERDKKEMEEELKLYEQYNSAYEETIRTVRMRQHEFENHMNAVLCMGNMITDYDTLRAAQKEYCMDVIQENYTNKKVKQGVEPVIMAFLLSKISLAEQLGIEVRTELHVIETKKYVKTCDLVEILGILLDNAIDALREYEKPALLVRLTLDESEGFAVEIANTSRVFKNTELEKFCDYGFSSKGTGRGLGLARLKMVAEKYKAGFSIRNITVDDRNYLCFHILFGR